MDQYEGTQSSVIGVQMVPESETHRYGIIDPVEKTIVVIKYVNLLKSQLKEQHHRIWQLWVVTY